MRWKKPHVPKKRSAEWYERNSPISLKIIPDSPLVSILRKKEKEVRSALLGQLEYLQGFVESFTMTFIGSRFGLNIKLSVVHGEEVSMNYLFSPAPEIFSSIEKFRIIIDSKTKKRFVLYQPHSTPRDIVNFLTADLYPVLRGASSEFVALKCFEHLSLSNDWIKSVRFASRVEDRKGIDLVVSVDIEGKKVDVPVQVKSSKTGQEEHIKNSSVDQIPSVVIPSKRSVYFLLNRRMESLLYEYAVNGKAIHIS